MRLTFLTLSSIGIGVCLAGLSSPIHEYAAVSLDKAASTLGESSKAALVGNLAVNDVVLEGERVVSLGSNATFSGPITLRAQGYNHSLVDIPSQSFLELPVRELCTTNTQGQIVGASLNLPSLGSSPSTSSSATLEVPGHGNFANCWSAPDWFFPATLISRAIGPNMALSYGHRSSNEEVLRFYEVVPGASDFWRNLTLAEVRLNGQTLLPDSVRFWHAVPGSNATVPLPPADPLADSNSVVTVRYGDYRTIRNVQVPFTIKWSAGDAMTLSIKVHSVVINGGIRSGTFDLPQEVHPEANPHP